MEYYFSFTDGMAEDKGYIMILAKSVQEAQRKFIAHYGEAAWIRPGILNYSFDYDYDSWKKIPEDIDMGECHGIIGLNTTDL